MEKLCGWSSHATYKTPALCALGVALILQIDIKDKRIVSIYM